MGLPEGLDHVEKANISLLSVHQGEGSAALAKFTLCRWCNMRGTKWQDAGGMSGE